MACPVPAGAAAPEAAPDENDLARLNSVARRAYAEAGTAMRRTEVPVLVVAFEELRLYSGGTCAMRPYTPAFYHRLKEVSHLPLGVLSAALAAAETGMPDEAWRRHLAEMAEAARAATDDVAALGLSEEQLARQQGLIAASLALIDELLASPEPPGEERLAVFADVMRPLALANATETAYVQLEQLHGAVMAFREELGPAWERTLVVVLGPRAPRIDNLAMSYFEEMLGADAARERLIYAENITEPAEAIALAERSLIDRRLGEVAFGDRFRLERDLLGDAARVWLIYRFGRLGGN